MISQETVDKALTQRQYKTLNITKKKKAMQLGGALPVYVNLTSTHGETTLVLHPQNPVVDDARGIVGLTVAESWYHSSNMRLFPQRLHRGKSPIGYGWGVSFDSETAMHRLLDLLEGKVTEEPAVEVSVPEFGLPPGSDVDTLSKRRIGQGPLRSALIEYWQGCAVTGLACEPLLRASHIVHWAVATGEEKTNLHNALLLAPHLDAAFDQGYISFDDDGCLLISSRLTASDATLLGLKEGLRLRRIEVAHQPFLTAHRTSTFLR